MTVKEFKDKIKSLLLEFNKSQGNVITEVHIDAKIISWEADGEKLPIKIICNDDIML